MPDPRKRAGTLSLLAPPYAACLAVEGGKAQLRQEGRRPGSALVWDLGDGVREQDAAIVAERPGGLALIVVLPTAGDLPDEGELTRLMARVRPQTILPAQDRPDVDELAWLLRRPPEDLAVEITDYLTWRGLSLDRETARLVRRTIEASAELRSISALARSLYMSRRALGRRFLARGLPVPSHWLHFGRVLRVCIRLQNSEESVLSIGYELGYPDGFSLSNQMARLVGYRPTDARAFLGWEWLLEAWLRREAETGGLAPDLTMSVLDAREQRARPQARGRPVKSAGRPREVAS